MQVLMVFWNASIKCSSAEVEGWLFGGCPPHVADRLDEEARRLGYKPEGRDKELEECWAFNAAFWEKVGFQREEFMDLMTDE